MWAIAGKNIMAGKILKSILTVAIAVLLIGFFVITQLLYQDFTYIQHTQLKDELYFAATATEKLGKQYLEQLPSRPVSPYLGRF